MTGWRTGCGQAGARDDCGIRTAHHSADLGRFETPQGRPDRQSPDACQWRLARFSPRVAARSSVHCCYHPPPCCRSDLAAHLQLTPWAARSRSRAGFGVASGDGWRQAEAAGDHQAREQIPARADHPRRAGGAVIALPVVVAAQSLVAQPASSGHGNTAVLALASKLARIAWAMLRNRK